LHQGIVTNEHQYVKNWHNVLQGDVCGGDFTIIFYINEYLQSPIYIWNRISKHIMFQCEMDFQSIPTYIAWSLQHFEPFGIEYQNR